MFRLASLASLLVAAHLASAVSISVDTPHTVQERDNDNLDEVVYLSECNAYASASSPISDIRDKESFLFYHPIIDETRSGKGFTFPAWTSPSFPKAQRVDGMGSQVDWTLATESDKIEAKFDKLGRTFWVHSLTEEGDSITNVTGVADLGGFGMRCYTDDWNFEVSLTDGYYRCRVPYFCTRERRQIRRTQFDISTSTVDVQILGQPRTKLELPEGERDPRVDGVISNVYYWLSLLSPGEGGGAEEYVIDKEWERQTGHGARNKIRFDWQAGKSAVDPGYDPKRIAEISEHLQKVLNPEIVKKVKRGGSVYNTDTWLIYLAPFPAHIRVQMQIAFQEQLDWKATDTIDIYIVANESADCGEDAAWAKLLSGVFAAAGAVMTGGYSAVMMGLGGLAGAYHTAACLSS